VSESERETLGLILEGRKRGESGQDLEVVCMMESPRATWTPRCRVIDELGHQRDEVTLLHLHVGSDLHVKYKLGQDAACIGWHSRIRVVGAARVRTTALPT